MITIPSDDDSVPYRCSVCKGHRALTRSGQLSVLAVRTPRRTFTEYLCDDCASLFSPGQWPRVRRLLRQITKAWCG
jgi:uncharacterized membrane protein